MLSLPVPSLSSYSARTSARSLSFALLLGASPALAAPLALQGGISIVPGPAPHVGPVPVHAGTAASGGGCSTDCNIVTFENVGNQAAVGTITGPISVTFGNNWFGLLDSDVGGDGNFGNEPSPETIAYVSGGAPTPIDFSAGINFVEIFYSAGSTSIPMTLTAWDGPGGTGNIVATAAGDVVGNGTNCTGDPTGGFCLWDAVTLTSTGNNILSITLAGAMSNQFGFDSMSFCTSGDADADGLLDVWETCGIDLNGDGTVDLDLPGMGADPNVPDIFVEIDAMSSRAPSAADLARVTAAFQAEGIQLHAMLDETGNALASWPGGWDDFDAIKAARFGTEPERTSGNSVHILNAKRQAFHYCVFADEFGSGSSAGLAEIGGNDFFITLGGAGWSTPGGTADERCGMFMHLLGHNLGLRDGGDDDLAFKPNYPSVMNPTWMLPRVHNLGRWSLAYSSGTLNDLDESMLDEAAGLGGILGQVAFTGPPTMAVLPAFGGADWDRSALISGLASADANLLDGSLAASPDEMYSDHDDWSDLVYNFRDSSDFATGVHFVVAPAEMDASLNASLDSVCPEPTTFCEGTPSSLGMTASMTSVGTPSLSGPDDFEVVANGVIADTFGVLVVSLGEDRGVFVGGTLCVEQPFVRTALSGSGGTAGNSDGELRGAVSQSFMGAQGWSIGTVVYSQWINRDFGLASNIGSTPGLMWVVCP